jgi:hypothetical protein
MILGSAAFSGLVVSGDGRRLAAVNDDGWLFTARLGHDDGILTGLHAAMIAPLAGLDGKRPRAKWRRDAEALAVCDERGIDGLLLVVYESKPRLELIDPSRERRTRRFSVPKALSAGPSNGEL